MSVPQPDQISSGTPSMAGCAVLLVAHGSVSSLDELPDFLRAIRRGRPASDALLREMRRRYELIGLSPLLSITRAQASALEKSLGIPVLVGMRFSQPNLESALKEVERLGCTRLCVLPLAPYSVRIYDDAVRVALSQVRGEPGAKVDLRTVPAWGEHPALVQAHAHQIKDALAAHPEAALLVTAHSLPLEVIRRGDTYAEEVTASVRTLERHLGRSVSLAYQSQGTEGDWLSPGLLAGLQTLARHGAKEVILYPMGFLADQVETLYDLDVEAVSWAKELGMTLFRVPALNDHPDLTTALADLSKQALRGSESAVTA